MRNGTNRSDLSIGNNRELNAPARIARGKSGFSGSLELYSHFVNAVFAWPQVIAPNRHFHAVRFLRADLDRGYLYGQEELSRVLSLEVLGALRHRFPHSSRAHLHRC